MAYEIASFKRVCPFSSHLVVKRMNMCQANDTGLDRSTLTAVCFMCEYDIIVQVSPGKASVWLSQETLRSATNAA